MMNNSFAKQNRNENTTLGGLAAQGFFSKQFSGTLTVQYTTWPILYEFLRGSHGSRMGPVKTGKAKGRATLPTA